MEKDSFGLVDAVILRFNELSDSHSLGPFLGKAKKFASIFKVDFP